MQKEITTLHDEKLAVHEKYPQMAMQKKEPLILVYHGAKMTIPADSIESRLAMKGIPQKDKFGPGTYQLWYYDWIPDKALSRGFTLIELLIVIAIVTILSAVIMSGLGEARQKIACVEEHSPVYCNREFGWDLQELKKIELDKKLK